MSNAPAGWYPVDGTSQRYWNGSAWTEHVAPLSGAPGLAAQAQQPEDQQPAGQQPAGQQPAGQQPAGQQPGNQRPEGQQPGNQRPAPQQPVQPQPPQAQPPGPIGQPGAGFPAGIGDPHDSAAAAAQQNWTSPPPGVPYAGHAPMPVQPGAPVASSADDRSMAVLCHVLGIFTGFIGPLIIWLIKKDTSPYVDTHGKAALNFQFSLMVYWLVSFVALFIVIGAFMMLGLVVLGLILPIVAAVTANKGEVYKYPMAIPFFS